LKQIMNVMDQKKIGIIGSGPVGQALATGFTKHGYEVMIGSRNPDKLNEWKSRNTGKIKTGTFSETAAFGTILVLAVKGTAAKNALQLAGMQNIRNKTIIDTTNPIADAPPSNGVLKFFTGPDQSLMEQLQEAFPGAHLVKSFSCVGNPLMVNPDFGGTKPTMFICGNNEAAKSEVKQILEQFGWEPEDMGVAEAARAIEPLCILWCIPGIRENRWVHAFKMLKV